MISIVIFLLISGPGQAIDPAKALADLAEFKKAHPADEHGRSMRANELLGGVNRDSVDVKLGDQWAKLFLEAGDYKRSSAIAEKYAQQQPDRVKKSEAILTAIDAATSAGDVTHLWELTRKCTPMTGAQVNGFWYGATWHAPVLISLKQGPIRAADYLELARSRIDWKIKDLDANAATVLKTSLISTKSYFLARGGKVSEAEHLVRANFDEKNPYASPGGPELSRRLKSIQLLNKPLKPLKALTSFGTYAEPANMKGKVVLLDFYSHWCLPCIETFPDTKRVYEKYHSKGLEIIGVTRDWGYFGKEQNLPPEIERQKLAGFLKDHDLPWPTAVLDWVRMEDFGISTVPDFVLIDKKGVVRIFDAYVYSISKADPHYLENMVAKMLAE